MQPYLFFHFQDRAISRLETEIDMPTALIRAQMLSIMRKKGAPKIKLDSLLPDRRGKKKAAAAATGPKQPWQQQLEIVKVLNSYFQKTFSEKEKEKAKKDKKAKKERS